MATNAVRWVRDYLAARDLDSEVAGGLVVDALKVGPSPDVGARVEELHREHLDVDHLSAKPLRLERLPAPLPALVRQVAVISLVVFGVLCGVGALFVAGGGVAVVLMPIVMGREGVGTAMITLFTVCVTFVVSGILLLAARSAARVIRRERRGVRTLYLFSVFGLIVAAMAFGIAYWLKVAFFTDDASGESNVYVSTAIAAVPLMFMAWFARAAFVLSRFAREIRKMT